MALIRQLTRARADIVQQLQTNVNQLHSLAFAFSGNSIALEEDQMLIAQEIQKSDVTESEEAE